MARLAQSQLNSLNEAFEERSPEDLLRWAVETFGNRLAAVSAMQKSGSVICHMISRLQLPVPILFVDTGVMFQETLDTRDRLIRDYRLKIHTLQPELSMEEQTSRHGVLYLSHEGQKECCHMRKVEPLRKVHGQYDCLIGSLRRAEGGNRGFVPVLTVDTEMNGLRINPLAKQSNEALEEYIQQHQVIINPLHSQGYSTIGCNRCTTPVLPGEWPRAGRWRHLGHSQYCGINPTDLRDPAHEAVELPQDLIDRILGLKTDFMI